MLPGKMPGRRKYIRGRTKNFWARAYQKEKLEEKLEEGLRYCYNKMKPFGKERHGKEMCRADETRKEVLI